MNPLATGAAGVAIGAFATWGTGRMMIDERTPSKVAPAVAATRIAAAAGAATWMSRSPATRGLFTGIALASVATGAAMAAFPEQLMWNDRNGALAGVHHPERLIVENPDVHVTGTVNSVSYPGDGDIHIRIKPDAKYRPYVDGPRHAGTLVTEPVPADQSKFLVPHAGDRISVDGPLVWDSTHGWSEVHPVRDLKILTANGPRTARDMTGVVREHDALEKQREQHAFIGGGVALAGVGLLTAGAWHATHVEGGAKLAMAAAGSRPWLKSVWLLGLGGVGVLTGALVGGQQRD